jgi:predicted lipoprotein with Yx(FWY)xxD motif
MRNTLTKTKLAIAAAAGAAGLAAAGVVGVSAATASSSHKSAKSSQATIAVKHNGTYGSILDAGSKHLTVYMFAADHGMKSACSGACLKAWPAVTTVGKPKAASGAVAADLGTIKRAGGVKQVTYKGHPLYYFVGDKSSSTAAGQDIDAFGARWYVLSSKGAVIKKAPPATAGPAGMPSSTTPSTTTPSTTTPSTSPPSTTTPSTTTPSTTTPTTTTPTTTTPTTTTPTTTTPTTTTPTTTTPDEWS